MTIHECLECPPHDRHVNLVAHADGRGNIVSDILGIDAGEKPERLLSDGQAMCRYDFDSVSKGTILQRCISAVELLSCGGRNLSETGTLQKTLHRDNDAETRFEHVHQLDDLQRVKPVVCDWLMQIDFRLAYADRIGE